MGIRTGTGRVRPAPPGSFVTAAGARVHYVRAGSGPPVVYIHGAKGSVYDFTLSVSGCLSERYTAVAMDRPGSGFSSRPADGRNSPQAQAAVLRSAAVTLGLERPVLVGHSLGAAVALAWALDAPESVAAAVTLGGYVLPLGGPRPWATRLLRAPLLLRGAGALGRSRLGRPLVRSAVERAFFPTRPPDEYLEIAPRLALEAAALVNDGEDRKVADDGLAALRPRYPALSVPLVIVAGTQDRMVPPAVSERLHALVPRSELVWVTGAGHMPQFSAPDAVVAAVDRAAALAGEPGPDRPGATSTFASPGRAG
jgi:pimeloyl-ACP methyl ester carboxylesterase